MNILRKIFQKLFSGSSNDDQEANKQSRIEGTPDLTERVKTETSFEQLNDYTRRLTAAKDKWNALASEKLKLERALDYLVVVRDGQISSRKNFIFRAKLEGKEANVAGLDKEIESSNREIDRIQKQIEDNVQQTIRAEILIKTIESEGAAL